MQGLKSPSEPYVSFVTFSRNDDYAGGLRKLYWSTRYLAEQCDEAGLAAESVIVEWNPPADREPLAIALMDLPSSRNLAVRIVTVPPHVHARYAYSNLRPMHGAVAANVGLRRARGNFLVVRVADAFYPDSLIRFLATRTLNAEHLYRAMRVDLEPKAADMLGSSKTDFLANCADLIALRNEHLEQPYSPFQLPRLFTNAGGDFQLLARDRWRELRGYWESSDITAFEADSMLSYSAYGTGIQEEVLSAECVYKIAHAGSHGHRMAYEKSWLAFAMRLPEAVLRRIPYGHACIFWIRVLLNYPSKSYGGIRKAANERSLLLFKLLSLFPSLTRLKRSDWGLAHETLAETLLSSASQHGAVNRH
jgi:hypothetical protein